MFVTDRSRIALVLAMVLLSAFLFTTLAGPGHAVDCSTTSISVTRVSASIMYVDTTITPQLRGTYVGYRITNSGAAIGDAWVDINNFAGGVVDKAVNETGRDHLGVLGTGASAFAYFYVAASGSTATAQTHDIAVYSGHPALGGTEICSAGFSIQAVNDTIKANANKVTTVLAGPNPAELGGIMTMTVTGQTGQVGSGPPGHPNGQGVFVATPATDPVWPADAYRLTDVQITFAGFGTYNDTLVVSGLDGSSLDYTAVYTFVAVGATVAPTSVTPVNYIASGTQIKHTDTSGFTASLAPILPTENKLLLSKVASPTQLPATGGIVNYTVTLSNTGTIEATIDDVVDVLPAGASFVAGSARFNGSPIPDPYIAGQTLSFVGVFGATAGGTSDLTYSAVLPGTTGTYVNSATGHIAVTSIDTSLDTTDTAPATATVQVGVLAAPPVANDDTAGTSEDTPVTYDVIANDTDPNGDLNPASVTITAQGSSGTAVSNGDGTVTYTPNADTNGPDTFTYQVCDSTSPTPLCDTADVIVNVAAVDDPPNAVDDTVSTTEETLATWDLAANDTDPDGAPPQGNLDPTSLTILSGPTNGTLLNNLDGTVTYTPGLNYSGADAFTYQICDTTAPTPLCDTATVGITVDPVNEAPVANPDAVSTPEDVAVTVDVAANDTDPDGNLDPTSVAITTAPTNGAAVANGDGTITYTPAPDYFGVDTFDYEICDLDGLCSVASAEVTTTVIQVDDPPTAKDDGFTVNEDSPATTLDLALNDTDPDGIPPQGNLDLTSLTILSGPSHGTLVNNVDGTVDYTPALNYNGPDSITYQICDTTGLCDTATVTITVDPVDDDPVANNDFTSIDQGTAGTFDAAANDTDPDGNLDPTTVIVTVQPLVGVATPNGDGTITVDYTASPAFTGSESLTYQICDATGTCVLGTATITVDNVPDPPVAVDDAFTVNEDSAATGFDLTGNDTDPDDGAFVLGTLTILSSPASGSLGAPVGGTVAYTPDPEYSGPDSFTYEICDATALCDSATVTITVDPVDDDPVANNDTAGTGEDTPVIIDVDNNDTDPDGNLDPTSVTYTPNLNFNGADSFTYQICDTTAPVPLCDTATVAVGVTAINDLPDAIDDLVGTNEDAAATWDLSANDTDPDGAPPQGNLDPTSLTILSGPSHGALLNNGDGTVTYTPVLNYNGPDSITYEICDTNNECSSATATIAVAAQPDPPVANDDTISTPEDTPTTVNVATNDTDVDGDLAPTSVSIVSSPATGTTTNNGDGTITYSPAADASGTFTITYQICDTTVPTPLCDQATLTVTVLATDDPPVVVDDTLTVNEDTPGTVDVAFNDSDPDGNLDLTTVTITSLATNGATAVDPVTGVVTYTPNLDYTGADAFTYQICDGTGLCGTADVAVTVDALADGPITVDDNTTMAEDGSVTVDVAFNDSDPDGNLDPTTVTITSGPSNGTATPNGDGTITYDPDANWFGTETITYQICDTTAPTPLCATATLTVTVNAVPDLPVAQDDTVSTAEDSSVVIDVVGNDSDVDGNLDPTSVTISTPPTAGSVSVDAVTGAVTYSPPAEWSGIDSFEYQICDTGGNCDTAVATVTVLPVNDAPVAQDDSSTVPEDGSVTVDVMANDSDIDSSLDPASVTVEIAPAHGTTTVDPATGAITYTPDADFHGSDSLTYRVCDPGRACDIATVSFTVTPINDPPVRVNEVTFDLLLGGTPGPLEFVDPEAHVYSATVVGGGLPPGLQLQPDGTFVGQAQVVGVFTATIEVCDIHGACSTSVLVLQVAGATLSVLPFTGPTLVGLVIGALTLLLGGAGLSGFTEFGGAHRRRRSRRGRHRARR
jgi:hypothetical protein